MENTEDIDTQIKKLNIDMTYHPIEEKVLKEASYIIIRHAYSLYNHKAQEIEEKYGAVSEELLKLKGDSSMYDPGLHAIGIRQAETNMTHINSINFRVVFVSPLQRTIQTTIHLFKTHPNKKNIRFVVCPIVREVLETSNDISKDVKEVMAMYDPSQEICEGLNFDFSMMFLYGQPDLWQIYTLANLQK